VLSLEAIRSAGERIRPFIHRTPLIHSRSFSMFTGADVFLKAENLQKTGSFKVRGAFNKLIGLGGGKVIAASMGNHAQAVAFAASNLDMMAKIIMPVAVSIVKEVATRNYGAEVVLHGEHLQDAIEYAFSQEGYCFIHPFDDEEIITGQGTIGLEIMEELQGVDAVFVPVGGGGLISGIAAAVKEISPETDIIGVQTSAAVSAYDSYRSGKLTERIPSPTIADGIAVGRIGSKTLEIIRSYVSDIVKVREDTIAMAVLYFLERKKLVVEGAGAVPLAALLEQGERFRGKRVVLVVSGGNIDFTLIDRIIHKGLATTGRIGVLEVTVDDIPGSLHSLTGIIASMRGNILNVVHDRLAGSLPVGKTRVIFTVEVRSGEHLHEILSAISAGNFEVRGGAEREDSRQ
jgi:threonine dehydratase